MTIASAPCAARRAEYELELADLVARQPDRPGVVALDPHLGADRGAEAGEGVQRRGEVGERLARGRGPGGGHGGGFWPRPPPAPPPPAPPPRAAPPGRP